MVESKRSPLHKSKEDTLNLNHDHLQICRKMMKDTKVPFYLLHPLNYMMMWTSPLFQWLATCMIYKPSMPKPRDFMIHYMIYVHLSLETLSRKTQHNKWSSQVRYNAMAASFWSKPIEMSACRTSRRLTECKKFRTSKTHMYVIKRSF